MKTGYRFLLRRTMAHDKILSEKLEQEGEPVIYPILLCAGAAALVWYIREKVRAYSLKAVFLKTLVSALFVAVGVYGAWRSAGAEEALLCPFVLMGLLFGLLGDVWLDLKYVFPEKDEPFTYAGFTVFGVGHILYIAGMLLTWAPAGRPAVFFAPLLLALLLSAGNAVLEKPMGLCFGKMKPVVLAYGFLLFSTVTVSGALALVHGWRVPSLNLLFAGGVLFALSDLVLSGTYFGKGKERPIDLVLNYLTYYPAQFLIASSLLFLC